MTNEEDNVILQKSNNNALVKCNNGDPKLIEDTCRII